MDRDDFLRGYINNFSKRYGGEREFVRDYLQSMNPDDPDIFLPDNPKEYIPLRNKAFDQTLGKGFAEAYDKYKVLGKFIKDMSSETPNTETYLFVKENISKYQLNIDIVSKAIKDKVIEINTTLKFEDKDNNERKSYFEIVFATIVKISDEVREKKEIEKIVLCEVQKEIYPDLEKSFLDLVHNSGYPGIKIEKKIDFEKLYNQKFN